MFHGAARKTLSIFGCYCVQTNASGERDVVGHIILVSEVIELSALFGALCLQKALEKVSNIGTLAELILGFDSGTHFRSYESLFYFLHKMVRDSRTTHPIELSSRKVHGKSMADAEIFAASHSTMAWYEWLRHPNSFADDEHQVVEVLKTYAARESRAKPFRHSVPHRVLRASSQTKDEFTCCKWMMITSHAPILGLLLQVETVDILLWCKTACFSSSGPIHRVHYSVVDKPTPPEKLSWKRGYWNDPVWKTSTYSARWNFWINEKAQGSDGHLAWSCFETCRSLSRTFWSACSERWRKIESRQRALQAQEAGAAGGCRWWSGNLKKRNSWCPPLMACIEKGTIIWTGNHEHRQVQFNI